MFKRKNFEIGRVFILKANLSNNLNKNRNELYDVLPLSTPYSMFIDVCNACNFKCKFCAVQYAKKELKFKRMCMTYENFKKIIDDLKGFSQPLKMMRLYGNGEPLLNKDLPKMIEYAKKSGVTEWVEIVTNASLLSPELNKELADSGLDRIRISIEGLDAESYEQISSAKIDWDNFVGNIRDFYNNKKQCEVYIKTVDAAVQEHQNEEKFFSTFGDICDKIFVENIAPLWAGYDKLETDFSISKEKGLNGLPVKDVAVCPFPFYTCMINPDGEVTACCADWERKIFYGNALEENICDIWNGKKHNGFLMGILLTKIRGGIENVCSECKYPCYNAVDNLDDHASDILEKFERSLKV